MGTLSSGSVGGFCSAHRGPTFCESRSKYSILFPRYSGSNFFLLAPISSQPTIIQNPRCVTWQKASGAIMFWSFGDLSCIQRAQEAVECFVAFPSTGIERFTKPKRVYAKFGVPQKMYRYIVATNFFGVQESLAHTTRCGKEILPVCNIKGTRSPQNLNKTTILNTWGPKYKNWGHAQNTLKMFVSLNVGCKKMVHATYNFRSIISNFWTQKLFVCQFKRINV